MGFIGCFIWAGIFNDPFQTFVSAEMMKISLFFYQAEKIQFKTGISATFIIVHLFTYL